MVLCAVIGCGLMGCKIAGDLALHGHRVRMYDSDVVILNSVCDRIKEDKRDLLDEGLLTSNIYPGSVLCISRLEECLKNVDIVFEAVPDDFDIKSNVLKAISNAAEKSSVICTNTLRLNIEKLSENIVGPERFIGLRFLYPVYFIPEVEINPIGSTTSTETLSRIRNLLEGMGKTLFFRSGKEPLILTDEQRYQRWQTAKQELTKHDGLYDNSITQLPDLGSSLSNSGYFQNSTSQMQWCSSQSECAICLDRSRDCLLEPCRHLILCRPCALLLLHRNDFCPLCRAPIDNVTDVYLS